MSTKPRFVLDTNVVISALLLEHSLARRAFDQAFARGEILISPETVSELYEVLQREKFHKYVTETERAAFIAAFVRAGRLVEVTHRVHICRDPRDDKFLALALSGKAACIVSGDKDLLALHPFHGVKILTPRHFLAAWKKDTP